MAVLHGDPTVDSDPMAPRPGKQNRGNRRSGAVKGTHSGTRRGQLPWQKDPLILARVARVRRWRAQGYTQTQILDLVNAWLESEKQLTVTIDTVKEDYRRVNEIIAGEQAEAGKVEAEIVAAHIESLTEVKQAAWEAFHAAKDSSLNRSSFLATLRATEETIGKFDRTFVTREERKVEVTDKQSAARLIEVLRAELGDDEKVQRVLDRMAGEDTQ